ncbi:MAG: ABC transporter substrate-binding protein [bacterium]|nr:ABC transporter substrate-binding protein [bacterium]
MENFRLARFLTFMTVVFTLLIYSNAALAEVGVTDTTIKIGNISDTNGPVAAVGIPRVEACKALVQHVNDQGGIHGRKLIYLTESDSYRPAQTRAAFKKLVEVDGVFAFVGSLGVGTVMSIIPDIKRKKIPYLMPGGSSRILFEPPQRYIFGNWPNFYDFVRIHVDYVVNDLKMPNAKFAHIGPDDELSRDTLKGFKHQLAKYPGAELVVSARFKRGSVDVSSQVAAARRANPDVVIISTMFVTAAVIAKEMKKIGWSPIMMMDPAAASPLLIKMGGKAVEGAIVLFTTEQQHHNLAGINFYKQVMNKYLPNSKYNPSVYGATGFFELMVAIEGLKRTGKNLTRESYIDALETIKDYDMGGAPVVTFGPKKRAGADSVLIYQVKNGKFVKLANWRSPR